MLLRYNARELAILAAKASEHFDKEGVLLMNEKQEGLFRKGETFVKHLFRLRGNLLFYFKTIDVSSEVIGVYVLERCMVQLDMEDEGTGYGFVIMFEGEDKPLQLNASSEKERAGWIESLHIASYECMKMQMQSLREQLRNRTGRDPFDDQQAAANNGVNKNINCIGNGQALLEIQLSWEQANKEGAALCKSHDTFVAVHYATPQKQHWFPLAHTEVVQRGSSADQQIMYLTTISIYSSKILEAGTKLKLMLYDVKEKMTSTMALLGNVIVTIEELLEAPNGLNHLKLESLEYADAGFLSVKICDCKRNSSELQPSKKLDIVQKFYDNIQAKTYRFPTDFGEDLMVHDFIAESYLCFRFPVQLLNLWVEEEKDRIEQLQELGELAHDLEATRQELLNFHMSTVSTYMQYIKYLSTYQGPPFKPSAKKGDKEVEFAPTNLHLHRMWVHNFNRDQSKFYDVTTVGAFTAYTMKYKNGGLRSLMSKLVEARTASSPSSPGATSVNYNAAQTMNSVGTLFVRVDQHCEALCRAALQGDPSDLRTTMDKLTEDTRSLIEKCANNVIIDGIKEHSDIKNRSNSASPHLAPPEGSWKWSGTDFVKSPTEEPWELTRLNTEAALVCVVSMVDELLTDGSNLSQWLEKLSPLMIKLKSCIQVMCQRAKLGLVYQSLKDCIGHVPLMHTIKYRRDICFSQALTAVVSAFVTKLHCQIDDTLFLQQLQKIGAFIECEGLMSCYTAEMGMIEDMCTAVAALKLVKFKLVKAETDDLLPVVTSNNIVCVDNYPDLSRSGYLVTIPLQESAFDMLPPELRLGQLIKVTAVYFNIGINEQATLAEKIGDLSTQEEVNIENYKMLYDYYEDYIEFMSIINYKEKTSNSQSNNDKLKNKMSPGELENLVRLLNVEVVSKKTKNVELLHYAADICRAMNGVRLTSCKSAKDRTAMSITLEQVQLLKNQQGLSKHMYMHALDCLRSEGLRRQISSKNTGSRKYAFNSLQLFTMPKLYRPPSGTYGNNQT